MLNANGVRTRQYAIAVEHRSDVKSQHDCLNASNAAARRVRKCCVELSLMWFVFERLVGPVHCFLMSGCFRAMVPQVLQYSRQCIDISDQIMFSVYHASGHGDLPEVKPFTSGRENFL